MRYCSCALPVLLACVCFAGVASAKVKVFILAGQSNMVGQAKVALLEYQAAQPETAPLFKQFRNDDGWVERDDVWIKFRDRKGKLTVGYGARNYFGPELQFGFTMGDHYDEPILLIKTAWGGKSLARDFRPPSSGLPDDATLKKDLAVPALPVVIGQFGVGGKRENPKQQTFKDAQAEAARLPEFKGNVALVKTDQYWDEVAQAVFDKGWREHLEEWNTVGSNWGFHYLAPGGRGSAGRAGNARWAEVASRAAPCVPVWSVRRGPGWRMPVGRPSPQGAGSRGDLWRFRAEYDAKGIARQPENVTSHPRVASRAAHDTFSTGVYLGSAKTFVAVGRAFAESMIALQRQQP